MKLNYLAALLVLAAAVSCSGRGHETTLKGIVSSDYDGTVTVKVADKDTVLTVESGTFKATLPVNLTASAYVQTEDGAAVAFISDGSTVTVDFTADTPMAVSSDAKGACAAYTDYQLKMISFMQDVEAKRAEISADSSLSQEQKDSLSEAYYDGVQSDFVSVSTDVIRANPDNYTALVAFGNIYYELDPETMSSLVKSLSPELQKDGFIVSISGAAQAQSNTAEGKMFTDFEVETAPGKIEKFSDYVGNGKYMLVDFWASWCGPCKAEIPNLKEVYSKYHGENFDILSVAVWDKPQASLDTAAAYKIPWNHMVNTQKIATDIYGIQGIPHIILVGPDGTILKRNLRGEAIGQTVSEYVK